MPSNWSKIRDEWLDKTAIAKDDAKWALEALINSEEELFEIEQKIKNKYKTEMLPISGPSETCWENSWSFPLLTNEQKINLKNIWNESLSP